MADLPKAASEMGSVVELSDAELVDRMATWPGGPLRLQVTSREDGPDLVAVVICRDGALSAARTILPRFVWDDATNEQRFLIGCRAWMLAWEGNQPAPLLPRDESAVRILSFKGNENVVNVLCARGLEQRSILINRRAWDAASRSTAARNRLVQERWDEQNQRQADDDDDAPVPGINPNDLIGLALEQRPSMFLVAVAMNPLGDSVHVTARRGRLQKSFVLPLSSWLAATAAQRLAMAERKFDESVEPS